MEFWTLVGYCSLHGLWQSLNYSFFAAFRLVERIALYLHKYCILAYMSCMIVIPKVKSYNSMESYRGT
jgi:hypothetical protein